MDLSSIRSDRWTMKSLGFDRGRDGELFWYKSSRRLSDWVCGVNYGSTCVFGLLVQRMLLIMTKYFEQERLCSNIMFECFGYLYDNILDAKEAWRRTRPCILDGLSREGILEPMKKVKLAK